MTTPQTSGDPRVLAALREFQERRDRGETIDREQFLAERADIADELQKYLVEDEELQHLIASSLADSPGSTHSNTDRGLKTQSPKKRKAASSDELPAQFGRYRIIRALGSGAMGTVYLAEDTQLQRQVALKTSSFDDDETGEMLARFYREAQSAATLRHSSICPVYDVGQIEGRHFISMAYIEGEPLSAHILPEKPFSEKQALVVARKLALGLQEAHEHGVIHRDLKPGNIMVDSKSEPIITDFGLALSARHEGQARLTQSGMIVGSPAYMSPEQVEADPDRITPATDQYSLGVILFEMLTGSLPFSGSITAIIGAILTKEPPRPSEVRPGLDPRLEALCLKMMAKSPRDRFPNLKAAAAEMAAIFKALAVAGATTARAASTPAAPPSKAPAPPPTLASSRPAVSQAAESTTESNQLALPAVAKKYLAKAASEEARIHWSAIAFGLAVFGVVFWVATLYFRSGDAVVKVTIHDPDVRVAFQGRTLTAESVRNAVKVNPGEGTLKITYGDAEFETSRFMLRKGQNQALEVTLQDDTLAAKLGDQPLGEWSVLSSKPLSTPAGASWIDLLSRVRPDDENSRGTWTRTPGGYLHGDAKGNWAFPELSLAVHPTASYELELGVVFHKSDHVIVHLPAGRGMANLILIRSLGAKGLVVWQKSGPFAPLTQPAEQVFEYALEPDKEYIVRLTADVAADLARVRLSGTIDGERLPALEEDPAKLSTVGPPAGMKLVPLPGLRENLGLHVGRGSTTTITRLRYRLPDDPAHGSVVGLDESQDDLTTRVRRRIRNYSLPMKEGTIVLAPHVQLIEATRSGDKLTLRFSVAEMNQEIEFVKLQGLEGRYQPNESKSRDFRVSSDSQRENLSRRGILTLDVVSKEDPLDPLPSQILTSPHWEWTEPENLGAGVNTGERELSPALTSDEKILVFVRNGDLWESRRESLDKPFGTAVKLGPSISRASSSQTGVAVSGDGLLLIVASNRGPGTDEDIYLAERKSVAEPFRGVRLLPSPVSSGLADRHPTLSLDGLQLIISSERKGGQGMADLHRFTRATRSDTFGNEENLGPVVNTPKYDFGGAMTSDGLVLFRSTFQKLPSKARDEEDLGVSVMCLRHSAQLPFESTLSFGPIFETHPPFHAVPSLDGRRLYFMSRQSGGFGKADLWMARRVRKAKAD